MKQDDRMTLNQVCVALNLRPVDIDRLRLSGALTAEKAGLTTFYSRAQVEAFDARRNQPATQPAAQTAA